MGLLKAFFLQYAIIIVGGIEAGYNSILTLYTYYKRKFEEAIRGKVITIYILVNKIYVQKNKY